MPADSPAAAELLASLEARHDDLLTQIDSLNEKIESALEELSADREEAA